MASDQEVRQLIDQIVSSQRHARQVLHGMTSAVANLAAEENLDLTDQQSKDVARSLIPRLAELAWPDTTSTTFEIPVRPNE